MVIALFTDFGAADIYVGQVKAALHRYAPEIPAIDLMHEAPAFNVRASAHLLAALAGGLPPACIVMAVVDPGVGGTREPVVVRAGDRWVVAPDNGLVSVLAARADRAESFALSWRPEKLSASFHGRDLFAPFAAMLATGAFDAGQLVRRPSLDVDFGAGDLGEIIYIDHYGNAMSGLRAAGIGRDVRFRVNGRELAYARVFSDVPPGVPFWYENSIGLVEFAENFANASEHLEVRVGSAIAAMSWPNSAS